MRKGDSVMLAIAVLLLGSFVSAQPFTGISDVLYNINPVDAILIAVFLISYTLVFTALKRSFRGAYQGGVIIISLVIAFLITYSFNQSNIPLDIYFYNLGFSEGLLSNIFTIGALILAAIILWKFGFGGLLIALGGVSIILGLFAYDQLFFWIIGAVLILTGIWLKKPPKEPKGEFANPRRLRNMPRKVWKKAKQRQMYKRELIEKQRREWAEKEAKRKREEETRAKQRTKQELLEKYDKYVKAARKIYKEAGNHIPSKEKQPKLYHKWKRYTQAVKVVEKMLKNMGN